MSEVIWSPRHPASPPSCLLLTAAPLRTPTAADQATGMEATWEIDAGGASEEGREGGQSEDEPYNPDFNIVERVIAEEKSAPRT